MGRFDQWCFFCGGPFDETQQNWLDARNWDLPGEGSLSSTPSPTPTDDIVTISQEDGLFWSELLFVGPSWRGYVSGCMIGSGTPWFDDDVEEHPYLTIHPECLSFLCRRINASPKQIWSSLYSLYSLYRPGQDYLEYRREMRCLLEDLEYYDITEFHDEYYYYCVHKSEPKEEDARENDYWWDPDSMKELQWLLARPTVFPVVPSLSSSTSIAFTTTTSSLTSQSPCMEVFNISELFDVILDYIIGQDISQMELADELQPKYTFTPLSVIQSTKTIFALLQVNKSLCAAFLRDRQVIFLRLAWMHGWMLPFTPQDWNNWPNGTFHNGIIFEVNETQDWRVYLLTFLRKEDVHVRNRWRFHKMAVQFARGIKGMIHGRMVCWRSDVGELGFRPGVKPPRRWFWEEGGFEEVEDEDEEVEDEDEEVEDEEVEVEDEDEEDVRGGGGEEDEKTETLGFEDSPYSRKNI